MQHRPARTAAWWPAGSVKMFRQFSRVGGLDRLVLSVVPAFAVVGVMFLYGAWFE
jgi:hypothetical protein